MKSGQGKTRDRVEARGVAVSVLGQLEVHRKLETPWPRGTCCLGTLRNECLQELQRVRRGTDPFSSALGTPSSISLRVRLTLSGPPLYYQKMECK